MTVWLMVLWIINTDPKPRDALTVYQFNGGGAGVRCNAALTEITKASGGRVRGVCVES